MIGLKRVFVITGIKSGSGICIQLIMSVVVLTICVNVNEVLSLHQETLLVINSVCSSIDNNPPNIDHVRQIVSDEIPRISRFHYHSRRFESKPVTVSEKATLKFKPELDVYSRTLLWILPAKSTLELSSARRPCWDRNCMVDLDGKGPVGYHVLVVFSQGQNNAGHRHNWILWHLFQSL